jgi:LacI family transcriptional regulator
MNKVSLKDIAKIAGVVPSTVSAVLNGKEKEARISELLSKKIRKIATELGYQPNFTAVSLRTGKTGILGLIVEDISNPFFASLAKALEDEAYKHNYRILYGSTENNDDKGCDLLKMLFHRQVEGFIIAPSAGMKHTIEQLLDAKMPVVLIDRYFPDLAVPATLVDNYQGIQKVMEHLLMQGYTHIGFVTVALQQVQMQQREQSYEDQLRKSGIPVREELVLKVDFDSSADEKLNAITQFISGKKMDAVVFATNYLGISGLEAIKHLSLKIPTDLAVVCFDDAELFKMWTPGITTLAQPIKKIAKSAVDLLYHQLTEKEIEPGKLHILHEPQLVVRSSS